MVVIMEHSLTIDEIVNLPETIKTWKEIHENYAKNNKNPKLEILAKWNKDDPKELKTSIQLEWDQWEKNIDVTEYCRLDTTMFELKINRKTIHVSPWPHHKYGNLYYFPTRNYLIEHIRMIGRKFKSSKIIYCADSACSTAMIEEKSLMGSSLNELIEFGINTFGLIPDTLTKGVYNYFFVDDYELDLEDYPNDAYIFNRSNEEYFLEKKFGEHYIIKRR